MPRPRAAVPHGAAIGQHAAHRRHLSKRLRPDDRRRVVEAVRAALSGAYAHLSAKRAAYAVDPVTSLDHLHERLEHVHEAQFHREVNRIVNGLRDAHTRYSGVGGPHQRGDVAALPFTVEECGSGSDRRFVVTKVVARAGLPRTFVPGVELVWWNAMPFARALDVHGEDENGGRPDSRARYALDTMTQRPLWYLPSPDEQWVEVGYRSPSGVEREATVDWRVVRPLRAWWGSTWQGPNARRLALDPVRMQTRAASLMLNAPDRWQASRTTGYRDSDDEIPTRQPQLITARTFRRQGRDYGYLRLWSFAVSSDAAYIAELARLLRQMPPHGVVVDLRGNPGGYCVAAERALQLFSGGRRRRSPIEPVLFAPAATPFMRTLASVDTDNFGSWSRSLRESLVSGEAFGVPQPMTSRRDCNDVGPAYSGAVVAVADSNTYSSGDIFCAGWVDNEIGRLVTVDHATGGGGAVVWEYPWLRQASLGTRSELPVMPRYAGLSLAVFRAWRSGRNDGAAIEDAGVVGLPHQQTEDDLLRGNRDLLTYCAGLLDDA